MSDYDTFDGRFGSLMIGSAAIERLWTGGRWTEGPVYVPAAKAVVGGIRGLMSPEAAQLTAQAARNDIPLSTGEALGQDSRLGRAVRGVEGFLQAVVNVHRPDPRFLAALRS